WRVREQAPALPRLLWQSFENLAGGGDLEDEGVDLSSGDGGCGEKAVASFGAFGVEGFESGAAEDAEAGEAEGFVALDDRATDFAAEAGGVFDGDAGVFGGVATGERE